MSISTKTNRILWAKSANRCAFPECKKSLVEDATETDSESVVGEACHIVAQKNDGPRGISELSLLARDEYDNLIVLCNVHHKIVDDQPGKYTVEKLKQFKSEHEAWVDYHLPKFRSIAFLDKSEPFSDRIYGSQKQEYINQINYNWAHKGPPVTILQGFSGVGKTKVIENIKVEELTIIDSVDVGIYAEGSTEEVMQMIAGNLAEKEIPELFDIEIKNPSTYFDTLTRIIKREKVLIIINEFDRLLTLPNEEMSKHWQNLVRTLNNTRNCSGRLLLVSNKSIENDIWAEKCQFLNLQGLNEDEGAGFLRDYLVDQNLSKYMPEDKLTDVVKALDGNPRALQLFSSELARSTGI